MKVKLAMSLSGSRDGVPWPERGSVVDLPDGEARDMLASGVVVELDDETVQTPDETETVEPTDEDRRPDLSDVETADADTSAEENTALTTANGPTKTVRRANTPKK